jgi:hypothetical protein
MATRALDRVPARGAHLYGLSLATILLCVGLWLRAKTVGEDERGNAERRALFVGLWPPMFWLLGDALRRRETRRRAGFLRRPGRT